VVEGVGDHGCEYMTGGRVVVLGRTGRNFAAGMSGGVAYVLDQDGDFSQRCNREMVQLERVDDEDERFVQELIERHRAVTDSPLADRLLTQWAATVTRLVRVMPSDYKKALEAQRAELQGVAV
jgi:glutamate synthase (NADPH) large chain